MKPRSQNKPPYHSIRRIGVLVLIATFLMSSACSVFKKDKLDTEQSSAEALYGRANEAQLKSNWAEAIEAYRQLEARYPYGKFAKQAQIATAYAHYKLGEDGLAIAAADRFISLNPTHASVDYAYYIKGLASFKEVPGIRGVITGRTNLSDRDPQAIADALAAFTTIAQRYPNSRYVADARRRIGYLNSALAQRETGIAHFYFQQGAYIAAINRAKEILSNYPNLPQAEDALGIMFHSYEQMQMSELASDTRRILTLNYPQSGYLKENASGVRKGGLLSRLLPFRS